MTDMTIAGQVLPEQAQAAHEVNDRVRQHVRLIRTAWIKLAEDLFLFNDQALWQHLSYQSFEEWLAAPEIELERRWVYDLIAMWRELVVNRGIKPAQLEPVHVSKVREVLPAIRRGYVEIDEALADCEALARRDLEQKYRGMASGDRRLDADREPEFAICHACGSRYPVRRAA